MPLQVCFVVGARPNFMKAAPVMRALQRLDPALVLLLVHTGQHYDAEMSDVFIRDLDLPKPDVFLGVGSGSHGEQTARVLTGFERVLKEHEPDLVVVAGDVNSTLAAALAAVKLSIPVAHIESGLRSFDPAMPEEHNRKLTDHLSAILLTHSQSANDNLAREGIGDSHVRLVGNTMIDSLLEHLEVARRTQPWDAFGLRPKEYGLVTLHRPTLVDDPQRLAETVDALRALADFQPLIFPVHPRTLERLRVRGLDQTIAGTELLLVGPLGYLPFIGLESEARFVLTDSGGVQEETSALGIPCFTLRDTTERPVTLELGTNILLGTAPDRIADVPGLLDRIRPTDPIPLWDGHAGSRAAKALASFLHGADMPAEAVR